MAPRAGVWYPARMTDVPFDIYLLVDPRDYRPYYVGETKDRVRRHRSGAIRRSSRRSATGRNHKRGLMLHSKII